jgi:hypothetical protein
MPVEFKIPNKPTIKLIDSDGSIERDSKKAGISPPPPPKRKGGHKKIFLRIHPEADAAETKSYQSSASNHHIRSSL